MTENDVPDIILPADWPDHVVRAILHLIALAHYAFVRTLGLAMDLPSDGVRAAVEVAQLRQALLWRNEEIALLRCRLGRVAPRCRPHYRAHERLNILELQAAPATRPHSRRSGRFFYGPRRLPPVLVEGKSVDRDTPCDWLFRCVRLSSLCGSRRRCTGRPWGCLWL